ncbi:MAG TPA: YraN family protein [Phycisphaerales bacterium]|nr:YraN family protein [Phycisphaerales bacterium]
MPADAAPSLRTRMLALLRSLTGNRYRYRAGDGARLGARGEDLCAEEARRRGWRVLARNARTRRGEADLVCADDAGAIVIIEVKTRTRTETLDVSPFLSIDPDKLRRLRRIADLLRRANRWEDLPVRVEAWAVTIDQAGPATRADRIEARVLHALPPRRP